MSEFDTAKAGEPLSLSEEADNLAIDAGTKVCDTDLQLPMVQIVDDSSHLVSSAVPNSIAAESSRHRTQTAIGREYTKQLLCDQFNGWVKSLMLGSKN